MSEPTWRIAEASAALRHACPWVVPMNSPSRGHATTPTKQPVRHHQRATDQHESECRCRPFRDDCSGPDASRPPAEASDEPDIEGCVDAVEADLKREHRAGATGIEQPATDGNAIEVGWRTPDARGKVAVGVTTTTGPRGKPRCRQALEPEAPVDEAEYHGRNGDPRRISRIALLAHHPGIDNAGGCTDRLRQQDGNVKAYDSDSGQHGAPRLELIENIRHHDPGSMATTMQRVPT